MVYRLIISYRGTAYAGWQRQSNALAVQEVVERALAQLLASPVRLHSASRTDAGVHARGQAAHLDLERCFPVKGLVLGTNLTLPEDVRILAAHRMPAGFHARKTARGKEYLYRVHRGRAVSPLDAPFTMRVERPLDLGAVRTALGFLPGHHDFTAFASAGGSHGQPIRHLWAATVDERGPELRFRFFGDGFLRGMVRALVGTLVEVGEGRRTAGSLADLLTGRPRQDAGRSALAQGLTLEHVFYPPRWAPLDGYEA